mmetsp:Transcript_26487/g.40814  ORF Transcript_26487/g.40814 Transcript_26487/m.40814 type:complete len:486 (-) Transcript_26487:1029-2486(-)
MMRLAVLGLHALFLLLPLRVECFLFPYRPSKQLLRLRSSVNDNYGDHYYGGEKRGSSYMSNHAKRDLMERRQVKRFHQMASMDDRPQGRAYPPGPYPPRGNGYSSYPPSGNGYEQQYMANEENMRQQQQQMQQHQQQQMQQQLQQQQLQQQQPQYDSFSEPDNSFNQDVSASLKAMTEILKEVKYSQKTQSQEVEFLSKKCDDMATRLSTMSESKNRKMMEVESNNPFGESLDGNFNDNVKDFVVDKKSTEDYVDELSDLKAEINRLVDTMMLTEDKLEQKMDSVYQRLDNDYQRLGNKVPMDEASPFGDDVQRPFHQPQPPPPPMSAPIEDFPLPPEDPFYDPSTYYMERNAPYAGEMGSKNTSLGSLLSANEKKSGHRYEQQPQNQSFISSVSKSELTDKRWSGFGVKPPRVEPPPRLEPPMQQQPPPPRRDMYPGPMLPPEYQYPEYYDEPYFEEESFIGEPFMGEPFMDEPYGGFDEGFYY